MISESIIRTYNHKMNSLPEIVASEKMENSNKIKSLVSDNENFDNLACCSRTSSIFDDSGFSTSTSEDRDDVGDSSKPGQQFYCHSANNLVENSINVIESNSHNPPPVGGKSHVWSELPTFESTVQSCGNVQSRINTVNKSNHKERQDSRSVNKMNKSVGVGTINGSNISSRNSGGFRRRQKTTNTSSDIVSVAQAHPTVPPASRRLRSRDINNNECGHMNFSSYLKKPTFKLQDCFQDQGLLSLVACIAYTFALMVVFCVIGLIMDYIKLFLGTQSLKIIRENIIHTRRPRPTMSSG